MVPSVTSHRSAGATHPRATKAASTVAFPGSRINRATALARQTKAPISQRSIGSKQAHRFGGVDRRNFAQPRQNDIRYGSIHVDNRDGFAGLAGIFLGGAAS